MRRKQQIKRLLRSSSAIRRETRLKNKSILLGVSGGVAAYKSVELVRRLKSEGFSVVVIMTDAAKHFVTPLSLEIASQNRVYSSLFEDPMAHINLPGSADVMVIAPATANTLSKFASGIADNLLTTCLLSFHGKVIIAPSMNWRMYENHIVQHNLDKLISSGVIQVGPERGSLACGEEGIGRMSEVADIVEAVREVLSPKDLVNETILVTGGPTREYFDPVRFISNRSSGKMGYALATAARNRGASVTLISGPSSLKPPAGIELVQVETAVEMLRAVKDRIKTASVLIMAAAVSDFSPNKKSNRKIPKNSRVSLQLGKTRDILSEVSKSVQKPFVIGFAAETGNNIDRAVEKMNKKKMDMIVFNDVTEPGSGFEVDTNRVVIIDKKATKNIERMSKADVADAVLDRLSVIKA